MVAEFKVGDTVTCTENLDEEFREEFLHLGLNPDCLTICRVGKADGVAAFWMEGGEDNYVHADEIQHTEGPW